MKKTEITDEELARRMRAALDARSESYDASTQSQLNQARQRALDELDKGRAPLLGVLPLAGASAAAVLVAVVLVSRPGLAPEPVAGPVVAELAAVDDFELLLAGDDLDMLENYEFYDVMEVL